MKRILVFSDPHWSLNSAINEKRWWPHRRGLNEISLKCWDWITRLDFEAVMLTAKKFGPYDQVLSLGDNVPGVGERGLCNNRAVREYRDFMRVVGHYFPGVPFTSAVGNHEAGYNHAVGLKRLLLRLVRMSPVEGAGINRLAIANCRNNVGENLQVIELDRWRIAVINTEIIRALHRGHSALELHKELIELAETQFSGLREVLKEAEPGSVILAGHDPAAFVKWVYPGVRKYANRIALTLTGHVHVRALEKVYRLHYPAKTMNLRVVPSTCRKLGKGLAGGFTILELGEELWYETLYVR